MVATPLDAPAEDPGLTRRERRKLEVRQRIVEASKVLFATQGIDATTIVEICERADVAEKTFFNHFTNKKQLLQTFAIEGLQQLLVWIEEARKGDGPLPEKLEGFFTRLVDEVDERGPMHRELLAEIVTVAHEFKDEGRQARLLHDAFMGIVTDGMERRDIPPTADVETLTEMLQGTYYTLTFNWAYLPDYPVRARAIASARFLARSFAHADDA
jgi:AcrR family transcriptional regulator